MFSAAPIAPVRSTLAVLGWKFASLTLWYHTLGAPRVAVTGNLKWDVPAPRADEAALAALRATLAGRPVLLGMSTHEGEEAALLDAHGALRARWPALLTILVPRDISRGESVARLAAARGLRVVIAGAGGAAHLPGMVAAMTALPVIGVPVKGSSLDGVDSLHSIVQMPVRPFSTLRKFLQANNVL